MTKTALKTIGTFMLMGAASLANANLITNGDFEEDQGLSGTQWQIFDGIPGWETLSGPGIEVQHNTITPAYSGNQYVELDSYNNTAMYQTVSGLTIGEVYELLFWYRPRTNSGQNDNGIAVSWGDSNPGSMVYEIVDLTTSNTPDWTAQVINLTASADTMYLGFAATGLDNSLGGFIDAVSLTGTVGQEIPTPAVPALLGLGLLALYSTRRGRSTRNQSA